MADLKQMSQDMQAAFDAHAKQSRENIEKVADQMGERIRALSNPVYGVQVGQVRKQKLADGVTISVEVNIGQGPIGSVHGGQSAVSRAVREAMDRTAQEAGLDSRR